MRGWRLPETIRRAWLRCWLGITLLWLFVSVNGHSVAAAVPNFDPASLVRFPLRFGRYLVLRTLIGLLTPSTIVGCLALLAAAVGIGVAKSALALPALVVLAVYALMNIFLTRMIGAWMERWLANRRFREIFSVLDGAVGRWIPVPEFAARPRCTRHGARSSLAAEYSAQLGSYLHWLPPGFAANAILHGAHPFAALAQFAGLLASAALFAVVFRDPAAQAVSRRVPERGRKPACERDGPAQRKWRGAANRRCCDPRRRQTARPVFSADHCGVPAQGVAHPARQRGAIDRHADSADLRGHS